MNNTQTSTTILSVPRDTPVKVEGKGKAIMKDKQRIPPIRPAITRCNSTSSISITEHEKRQYFTIPMQIVSPNNEKSATRNAVVSPINCQAMVSFNDGPAGKDVENLTSF